jgi:hypothetical protein
MSALVVVPSWIFEWVGAGLGLVGAALLSLNLKASRYGWLFFLLSNFAWTAYGIRTDAYGLVAMQVGFTLTSLLGVYRWLFASDKP